MTLSIASQGPNAKALEVINRWKKERINVSAKICQLIIQQGLKEEELATTTIKDQQQNNNYLAAEEEEKEALNQ